MRRIPKIAGVVAMLGVLLVGHGIMVASAAAEGRKLQVVTSLPPIYCFTINVAGENAEVDNLLPAGTGPHETQLSAKDVRKLNQADLVILNGLGLEAWLRDVRQANGNRPSGRTVEVAAGLNDELISAADLSKNGHFLNRPDIPTNDVGPKQLAANPHIWLDPRLAAHAVKRIAAALQEADPVHANFYATNAGNYLLRLEQLDRELRQTLEPIRSIAFVTQHDAFAYLVRRYELRRVGVVEKVPDIEPSARELVSLYRAIRENHAKAIFAEPQFSSRLIKQIARDLNLAVAELDPLETGRLTRSAYEDGLRKIARTLQLNLN